MSFATTILQSHMMHATKLHFAAENGTRDKVKLVNANILQLVEEVRTRTCINVLYFSSQNNKSNAELKNIYKDKIIRKLGTKSLTVCTDTASKRFKTFSFLCE